MNPKAPGGDHWSNSRCPIRDPILCGRNCGRRAESSGCEFRADDVGRLYSYGSSVSDQGSAQIMTYGGTISNQGFAVTSQPGQVVTLSCANSGFVNQHQRAGRSCAADHERDPGEVRMTERRPGSIPGATFVRRSVDGGAAANFPREIQASAEAGSMMNLTSETRLAGNPPCFACSRIISRWERYRRSKSRPSRNCAAIGSSAQDDAAHCRISARWHAPDPMTYFQFPECRAR